MAPTEFVSVPKAAMQYALKYLIAIQKSFSFYPTVPHIFSPNVSNFPLN